MRASFVDLYFGSRSLSAKSALGFAWKCVGVHQKHVNIRSAIKMAAAMTFCLTAIFPGKSILQIFHLWHQDLYMNFSRKILRANGDWSRAKARNFAKNNLLRLVNVMKIYFLFSAINRKHIQKKAPEKCVFYGWWFLNFIYLFMSRYEVYSMNTHTLQTAGW